MDSAIVTSMIAAGSATGGILLKTAFDVVIERLRDRKADEDRFIEERKAVYDEFLRLNDAQFRYRGELRKVTLIARAGRTVRSEVLSQFPASPMGDLVDALEKVRRVARTYEVVQVAERVVQLHGDGATALKYYLQGESPTYGLPLFLIDRFGEDQSREFVAAYRRDLRLGPPKGAAENFPIVERQMPFPMPQAEEFLREFLRSAPDALRDVDDVLAPRPLLADDERLLETAEYRALIRDGEPSS